MTQAPCKTECEALIAMAHAILSHLDAGQGNIQIKIRPLTSWLEKAQELLKSPTLETIEGERTLEGLSLGLRHNWLRCVHQRSDSYLMSPPLNQHRFLPDGQKMHFPYDRWLKPEVLQERLLKTELPPTGWRKQALVFSSGMSALTTFMQAYKAFAHRWWPQLKGVKHLYWWGGYFEITKSLHLLCDRTFVGHKPARQQNLWTSIRSEQPDLLLIEPISASFELDVFDLDSFVQAWKARTSKRPTVIIVDTSLTAKHFCVSELCSALEFDPPALVVEIRSGLKLDQQGFELSNVGLMELWAPESDTIVQDVVHTLQVSRTTLGAGLSYNEVAALHAPFFLDPDAVQQHSENVFAANRDLAQALHACLRTDAGLFSDIFHPSLGTAKDKPWAVAPFVNIRYRPNSNNDRAFLRHVIEDEAANRRLCFWTGTSFGFRSHRLEMGVSQDRKFDTFRVAMGSRPGPSKDGVIKLLTELNGYENFQALRTAYPHIKDDRAEQDEAET
ncbi:MAG: hypothetical protein OQK24_00220 [Magnetovibrio sp.]|nr:hypothetical protein [Magnetovibrio sp.]